MDRLKGKQQDTLLHGDAHGTFYRARRLAHRAPTSYEAARMLAIKGYRHVIVTGRSLARVQETQAAQLAAETQETGFHAAGAGSGLAVQRSGCACRAGQAGSADRFPAAQCRWRIEVSQAPLIGHHQLTAGLLNANLLLNGRTVIAGAEPARGGVPMFSQHRLATFCWWSPPWRGTELPQVVLPTVNAELEVVMRPSNNAWRRRSSLFACGVVAVALLPSRSSRQLCTPSRPVATATKVVRKRRSRY